MARRFSSPVNPAESSYAHLMQPSEQQIQAFAEAWKTDFGEELDPTCARAEALRLLDFFEKLAEGPDVNCGRKQE